jgi:hypothetical protein
MSEALLGVLLGGLIGIVGGFSTTLVQLRGSARAKERERRLSLKKEIVLEASLALDKPLTALANVGRFDLTKEQVVAPLQEGPGGWLNKLALVAEAPTQRAVSEALNCSIDCLVELILRRVEVERLDVDLEIVRSQISDAVRWQGEATEFIKALGATAQMDRATFDLRAQWQASEQTLRHARSTEALHLARRLQLQIALYSRLLELRTNYLQRLGEALVEMRKEIDLSANLDEWREIVQESQRRGEAAFRRLLDGLSETPPTSTAAGASE